MGSEYQMSGSNEMFNLTMRTTIKPALLGTISIESHQLALSIQSPGVQL